MLFCLSVVSSSDFRPAPSYFLPDAVSGMICLIFHSASTDAVFVENVCRFTWAFHIHRSEKNILGMTPVLRWRDSTQILKRKDEVQLELIMRIYKEENKFYLFS